MGDPGQVNQRGDASRDVDDELFALLGLRVVRQTDEPSPPAASSPRPMTFEELWVAVFETHPRSRTVADNAPTPSRPGMDPVYEQEFARLFGPRAHELLGQDVEPLVVREESSPTGRPVNALEATSTDEPAIHEHAVPAPTATSSPLAASNSAAHSPWTRALQIGSVAAAGVLVVLSVIAIRRRFAELRQLSASEVAKVRGELKAEMARLQDYVRGNPDAAAAASHLERTERELDDLFAEIDRRHQVGA